MSSALANALWSVLILILLVLVNAFFSMSEIAVLQANQNRIKKLSEEGDSKAKLLLKLTSEPSDFLATIQVGVTLSGFLASAVAANQFSEMLASALSFLRWPQSVTQGVSVILITLILSYFSLVFGELVPKRIGMRSPDRIALSVSGALNVCYSVLRPFVKLLSGSTDGILQQAGVKENEEEPVTQEDIMMMVEEGEEKGAIHELEMQMIQNIFDLDDKPVDEVMTHRTDMAMVSADEPVSKILALSKAKGYSRIPAYDEDFDDIIGIVYIKDLIGLPEEEFTLPVRKYLRKALYVPEGKLCSKLLLEFQEKKTHMAIVIDEYGGTAGLVTLEDLLEVIVGSIQDETDHEEPEMKKLGGGEYLFEGDLPLEDIEDTLHIKIDNPYDCESIGGYIMACLDRIPAEPKKDPVSLGSGYFAVAYVIDERRIEQVLVYRKEEKPSLKTE